MAAIQVENWNSLYPEWKDRYHGSEKDFYNFMTTPSMERELFVSSITPALSFTGPIATVTIKG